MTGPRARPWTPHEEAVLQRLAAAGKYAAWIAADMNRSESAIRSRAALLNLMLPRTPRGPKVNGEMKMTPRFRGRRWTPAEDAELLSLAASKTESFLIAQKLRRTIVAVNDRVLVLEAKGVEVKK
jgi:hypothetical protein